VEYVDPKVLHNSLFETYERTIGHSEMAYSLEGDENDYSIPALAANSCPHPHSGFYEAPAINSAEKGATSGFAIKSGWSSTFFI